MKKRILSIILTTLLIAAMAIPASATSISAGRSWNGVLYQTNDTCNTGNFHCVIESDTMEYALRTDVYGYNPNVAGNDDRLVFYARGNTSNLISTHSNSFSTTVTYMYAYHYLGGNLASTQKVRAS